MTERSSDASFPMPAKRKRFDRYVLDLERGCLLLGENEISLRPKTYSVLLYLVENAGRLVSKDEIFAAVWPSLAITDDTLVQSIGELRRAFGDDGPRLIRTVPRRGYRFEASVSLVEPELPAAVGRSEPSSRAQNDARSLQPVPTRDHERAVQLGSNRLDVAPTSASKPRPFPGFIASGASTQSATERRASWHRVLVGQYKTALAALAFVILVAAGAVLWSTYFSTRETKDLAVPLSSSSSAGKLEFGTKPTIAVLPFANQPESAARDYFADGLTQDIISALGRFSGLTVMSWNAVQRYKGKLVHPGEIATQLSVRYQVEGRVRRSDTRVRVTAQLVARDGRVIWSGQFEEALEDLFILQDKITAQIAGALAIRMSSAELKRVLAKPAGSLEAYDYVLRARPALRHPERARIVEARQLLKRAIMLEPTYAAAYASLAETYLVDVSWGWAQSPLASLRRAEVLANKALRINETEVQARVVLGRIHLYHQRFDTATSELDRAVAINPSDARSLAGLGNIRLWLGQTRAAIDVLEQAQRIDPELNAADRFALAVAYYLDRRYDAAIRQAEINLRNSMSARSTQVLLAAAYAQQGRREDAARIVSLIHRVDPTFDPKAFGNKLQKPADFEQIQDGLRKAGFYERKGTEPSRE